MSMSLLLLRWTKYNFYQHLDLGGNILLASLMIEGRNYAELERGIVDTIPRRR